MIVADLAALPASRAAGGEGALLRLAEQSWEVYRWTGLADLDSPVALNRVRRALLQAAVDARAPHAR